MKRTFILFLTVIAAFASFAQAPEEFNYQGVARNAQGQALANQAIKVRASLLREGPDGARTTFYSETRNLTTNVLGLFSFKINEINASSTTGSFYNGDWMNEDNEHYLKIELDVANSGTWTDMGTQKLSSVPFALFANSSMYAKELTIPVVAFGASSTTSQTVNKNATEKITFESVNSGSSNFNATTNEFTAFNYGMHHFNGTVLFNGLSSGNVGDVYLILYVNNIPKQTFRFEYSDNDFRKTVSFSTNINLNVNDKVAIYLRNNTLQNMNVGSESTFFNGNNIR